VTKPLKVLFCWAEVSGYMPACWRALARRPGVELHVLHPRLLSEDEPHQFESLRLLEGISNDMFLVNAPDLDRWLVDKVAERKPDVVVVCGWFFAPYRRLVESGALRGAKVVLGMDSPWRGTLAQRLGKLRLRSFVKQLDFVIAASERSAENARRIGLPDEKVRTGYYGFDDALFTPVMAARQSDGARWPRQFLYLGRYVPQKDLRTLVKAYSLYRGSVSDPWGLTCCGMGPDAALLKGVVGIDDIGFKQPGELPGILARHGAFVLASKYEPWGVVIAETAASGLPVICTTACGAGVDLVRPYYNGLLVTSGDAAGLARAMRWTHEHEDELPEMGRRGAALADAFSAGAWAARWHNYFLETLR
jgi:glycosyltransferase involved in cell wall biosynthesis